MTIEEAIKWLNIELKEWENDCLSNHPVKEALRVAIEALEQEPRKGHWINKHRFFDSSCSAECSVCHKRSNGYMLDNGFTLVSTYYDFCPKCGSDNREVEE
jgi:Zn finger protein HypA/HybF involved in hydrogenase expression